MSIARIIDSKYYIDTQYRIVKTSNDQPIPEHEPVILFRARDRLALHLLRIYRVLCQMDGCTPYQIQMAERGADKFATFAIAHEDEMKQPGSTLGR
jgi:hypothetical protein